MLLETLNDLRNVLKNPETDGDTKIKISHIISKFINTHLEELQKEEKELQRKKENEHYTTTCKEQLKKLEKELEQLKSDYIEIEENFSMCEQPTLSKEIYLKKLDEVTNMREYITQLQYPQYIQDQYDKNYIYNNISILQGRCDKINIDVKDIEDHLHNRVDNLIDEVCEIKEYNNEYLNQRIDNVITHLNTIKNEDIPQINAKTKEHYDHKIEDLEYKLREVYVDVETYVKTMLNEDKVAPTNEVYVPVENSSCQQNTTISPWD